MSADIPQALQTLHEGLAKMSAGTEAGDSEPSAASRSDAPQGFDDEEDNRSVALHTRAGPLISLLEAAASAGENVQWDS